MNWDTTEETLIRELAPSIASASVHAPSVAGQTWHLSPESSRHLIGGVRETRYVPRWNFVPVRHIYQLLGLDEHHAFQWRFEHKLVQSLLLQHFCEGCVPVTTGLSRFVLSHDPAFIENDLRRHFVKSALGSDAGPDNGAATEAALSAVKLRQVVQAAQLADEVWILQERLSIAEEYRVHTLEQAVIEDLTFARYTDRAVRDERDGPNSFVKSVIARLPEALLARTLCGWDVCRTVEGSFKIIEINLGGFHPVVERGFQCSGFFARSPWGTYHTARLLRFIETNYGVTVTFDSNTSRQDLLSFLYTSISEWHALLRIRQHCGNLLAIHCESESQFPDEVKAGYAQSQQTYSDILRRLDRVAGIVG